MRRRVLITGASRGIGRATALAFAALGDRVAVHYGQGRDRAEALLEQLPGDGHIAVPADIADPDAVQAMVEQVAAAFGRIDVLVNNAGVFTPHRITEVSYQQWQQQWQSTIGVNLIGAANVTWCAVQHMGEGGAIVSVSSRGAFRGEPGQPGYAASKAGLGAMSQSLAVSLAPRGIQVAVVAPGFVETDMASSRLAGPRREEILSQSPFHRVAQPEEIAAAIVWLASPQARWASGTVLDLNGASYLH
jgi:3-oxoacyl-[acyl-carrier protein] reductase